MKVVNKLLLLMIICFAAYGCDEEVKEDLLPGMWTLESITEDGTPLALEEADKVTLMIDPNGVYRNNAKILAGGAEPYFGAWSVTENKWLELTIDAWRLSPSASNGVYAWYAQHLPYRFTILNLTSNVLEIRISTFIGDVKYAALFAPKKRVEVNETNKDDFDKEFKTIKQYVFKLKK